MASTASQTSVTEVIRGELDAIRSAFRVIQDYPRPGLSTYSLETLTAEPKAFRAAIDILTRHYAAFGVTHVVSSEARGFIVGAPLAIALGAAFIPVRRAKKLPFDQVLTAEVRSQTYFAHGNAVEMQKGVVNKDSVVIIVDDVVGSGATVEAMAQLVTMSGASVLGVGAIAASPGLNGVSKLIELGLNTFLILSDY